MKIKTLLIILFFCTILIQAQEIKFGLKAGMIFPGFSLSNNVLNNKDFNAKGHFMLTYNANAIIRLKSDTWWELRFEPGYIKKGGSLELSYRYDNINQPRDFYCTSEYSNIELPILLNIKLNQNLYLTTGIGTEYTLSTKHLMEAISKKTGLNILPTINNKINCSAIFGGEYYISDYYSVALRYSFGLTKLVATDLIADTNYPFEYTPKLTSIYINSLQLSLIYNMK
jgi:hypothetical protein